MILIQACCVCLIFFCLIQENASLEDGYPEGKELIKTLGGVTPPPTNAYRRANAIKEPPWTPACHSV